MLYMQSVATSILKFTIAKALDEAKRETICVVTITR